jgi:hypothetical protein
MNFNNYVIFWQRYEWVTVMMLNATFNNISVISRRLVLLVVKPESLEKTTDLQQVTDRLDYIILYRVHFYNVVISHECGKYEIVINTYGKHS